MQRSIGKDKYGFIDAEYAAAAADKATKAPTISQMCEWLEVSRSGYYEWRNNPGSATARRREELKLLIQKAFDDSDGTYGYRRVHAQLQRPTCSSSWSRPGTSGRVSS